MYTKSLKNLLLLSLLVLLDNENKYYDQKREEICLSLPKWNEVGLSFDQHFSYSILKVLSGERYHTLSTQDPKS